MIIGALFWGEKELKHLFIINPKAGKYDRTYEILPVIERAMFGRGETFKIAVTTHPSHAAEIVREYASSGEDLRVYVCGGDGTLNEAAEGAAGLKNVAVTHYPCGTGNDFIKLFGKDTARFSDLNELIDGEIKTLDLIECGGRISLNICSVGLDARVAAGVSRFKRLPFLKGTGAYNVSLIYNLFSGLHYPYKVTLDGVSRDGRYTMLAACSGRFYGGGYNPVPEAIPDDGLLDFLLIGPVTLPTVARVIKKYKNGQHLLLPEYITWVRGHTMQIECGMESPINIDGEIIMKRNITFSLSEKKLNFIVPKGAEW